MGTQVIEVKQLKFEVVVGSEVILCPPRPTGTLVYSAIALLFGKMRTAETRSESPHGPLYEVGDHLYVVI